MRKKGAVLAVAAMLSVSTLLAGCESTVMSEGLKEGTTQAASEGLKEGTTQAAGEGTSEGNVVSGGEDIGIDPETTTGTWMDQLQGKSAEEIEQKNKMTRASVHDPAIVEAEGKFYVFGTHETAAKSEDLMSWTMTHENVDAKNTLFDNLFTDDMAAFNFVGTNEQGGYDIWAPDVYYNEAMGKWVMYYCSSHDYRTSVICMATADSVEGPYHYEKQLLYSGFTRGTIDKTNFYEICGEDAKVSTYLQSAQYNNLNYPNCIDPNVFIDDDGRQWMIYGSWSGGIWMLEIDPETGDFIHPETDEEQHIDQYYGKYLVGGLHNSGEGPYMIKDQNTGYYYLFMSYGGLTREGGYQIRVFRSKDLQGTFVDATGETYGYTSEQNKYGVKLMGNYKLPSLKTAYMAPGHNSILQREDGSMYVVYHTRMDSGSEYFEVKVHQLFMSESGWPVAAPFSYSGEALRSEGYQENEVEGHWYLVNHGTDISAEIHDAEPVVLTGDEIVGSDVQHEVLGEYSLTPGTNTITLKRDGVEYSGVLVDMEDEAGNPVRCLSAVGENNECLWGVMYLDESVETK